MHRFPHGITRPFLRTVWARLAPCLGLDLLLKGGADKESFAEKPDLHKQEEGCLLPVSGEEDNGCLPPMRGDEDNKAANNDLQPSFNIGQEETTDNSDLQAFCKGQTTNIGSLPPTRRGQAGSLPPTTRGDEYEPADDTALPPILNDGDEGEFLPLNGEEHKTADKAVKTLQQALIDGHKQKEGAVSPQSQQTRQDVGVLWPEIGVDILTDCNNIQNWYAHVIQTNLQVTVHCALHRLLWMFVHATNAWSMPSPRPRIKMKDDMPSYDTHAWEHDAWVSTSRHREPFSSPCLYIECSYPSVHHPPHLPSTSAFFLLACFSKEDEDSADEVLPATVSSIHLPFTPLRGRNRHQAREMQDELKMMACTGSKTKTMQMRLFYLMKDMLDPG